MIKLTYKPGIDISSFDIINNYDQFCSDSEIIIKGYYKYGKYINYQENYTDNQGIKYII